MTTPEPVLSDSIILDDCSEEYEPDEKGRLHFKSN